MSETNEQPTGKGRPTPPRKQQQQARKKPIVGDRSKEAKEAQKAKVREERQRARDGARAGDGPRAEQPRPGERLLRSARLQPGR